MDYAFLVDTYASERLKTLSVWAMFDDGDLDIRPHPNLARDRTFREHMVHQCLSEDKWFTGMFGIPLLTEVQVGGAAFKLVVFQTCPAVAGLV